MDEFMTVEQAENYCGYRAATLSKAIRQGKIKAKKFGPAWAVTRAAIDEWIKNGSHKTGRPRKQTA